MTAPAPALRYLGHSTVALDLDGVRVLTDPLLVDRLGPLHRHGPRPHPRPDEREVDLVLISHAHHDHLDLASLGRVRGRPRIVVPKGIAELSARAGHEVIPVSAGDRLRIGPLKIEALPARHDGGRKPFGPAAEALGFRIEGSASVYFAGDTGLFPQMAELAGSVDVALLPVWGWAAAGRWPPRSS